mgnify:FL=1
MLRSERIAKQVQKRLVAWQTPGVKLIVGIDGYAGAGKSTVADYIATESHDVLAVHLDDFIRPLQTRKRLMARAEDKAALFEREWYRYRDLERLLRAFACGKNGKMRFWIYDYDKNALGPQKSFDLSKRVLVIDGVFLFHPRHTLSTLIDRKIYLAADFARADVRRIAREKKRWGAAYIPENHPDNWTRHFKKAYRRYVRTHKPEQQADVVYRV